MACTRIYVASPAPYIYYSTSVVESPASKRIRELPSSVTTAEPSTTTDQQTMFADTETTSTSIEMTESEQPEVIADTQMYEQEQTPVTGVVDPSQIQEAESVDSAAIVTGTDEDVAQPLPQQSGDLAADTTFGAPDSKSELSPPQDEAQVRRMAITVCDLVHIAPSEGTLLVCLHVCAGGCG